MNKTITRAQFELQTTWFIKELLNISEEDSNKQTADHVNSIKWIAGHILNTRMSLLSILTGTGHDLHFNALFGKGSPGKVTDAFPTIHEISNKWAVISSALTGCLQNISDQTLASAPPFQTSVPDTTLHGLIAYMVSHEAFHLGQIAVLKKLI